MKNKGLKIPLSRIDDIRRAISISQFMIIDSQIDFVPLQKPIITMQKVFNALQRDFIPLQLTVKVLHMGFIPLQLTIKYLRRQFIPMQSSIVLVQKHSKAKQLNSKPKLSKLLKAF